ncbi:unnamed protein product [Urochloa humidicola]
MEESGLKITPPGKLIDVTRSRAKIIVEDDILINEEKEEWEMNRYSTKSTGAREKGEQVGEEEVVAVEEIAKPEENQDNGGRSETGSKEQDKVKWQEAQSGKRKASKQNFYPVVAARKSKRGGQKPNNEAELPEMAGQAWSSRAEQAGQVVFPSAKLDADISGAAARASA